MSELKSCPFCGGEAETTSNGRGQFTAGVRCKDIIGCGCHLKRAFRSRVEAIAAWNTRAERTCKNDDDDCDAWFKCSECGLHSKLEIMSGGYGVPNYCPNCGARVIGVGE